MDDVTLGVIGGSGLYQMEGLTDVTELTVDTPFGKPSDNLIVGTMHGQRIAFIARHGRGHLLSPTEVPYRANIYALKSIGVKYIVAVSACGSLREAMAPGHFVVPDQLFDHTKLRTSSFFGEGLVAHVSVADPFSAELSQVVADALRTASDDVHQGGSFITIEGPRFSTRRESHVYRQWGMDIIGMTTSPEAYLAAEAEIAFACIAHVTDYDVWHESEEDVTVEIVIRTVQRNTQVAKAAIAHLAQTYASWAGEFKAHGGLADAIITNRERISAEARDKFKLLVDKYL